MDCFKKNDLNILKCCKCNDTCYDLYNFDKKSDKVKVSKFTQKILSNVWWKYNIKEDEYMCNSCYLQNKKEISICVNNCSRPKYNKDLERYWLIKLLTYGLGKDIFNIIIKMSFSFDNNTPKCAHPMIDRCLRCNKFCHIAHCDNYIKGCGIDFCGYHYKLMYRLT